MGSVCAARWLPRSFHAGCGEFGRDPGLHCAAASVCRLHDRKVNAAEEGLSGFYWFDTLPFPAAEGAQTITGMYSKLFHDGGKRFRVLTRHNHSPGGGGTAFPGYIYGCGKDEAVTAAGLQALLAHEMVHNRPTMLDEPAGVGTWYVEGSAEYYSTMVSLWMGLASLEESAKVINQKAGSYYQNPCHNLSNIELDKHYWTDRRCQRLPCARGVLYLSNPAAQIQHSTDGKHSPIDIELALLRMEKPTAEDFLRIGSKLAGFDLRPEWEKMCRGILPPPIRRPSAVIAM